MGAWLRGGAGKGQRYMTQKKEDYQQSKGPEGRMRRWHSGFREWTGLKDVQKRKPHPLMIRGLHLHF